MHDASQREFHMDKCFVKFLSFSHTTTHKITYKLCDDVAWKIFCLDMHRLIKLIRNIMNRYTTSQVGHWGFLLAVRFQYQGHNCIQLRVQWAMLS